MPCLLVYNRRSIFAGDDLQPTALITMAVRMGQVILFLTPLIIDQVSHLEKSGLEVYYDSSCGGSFSVLLTIYTILTLVYNLTSVLLEWSLYKASGIGTPIQPELRQPRVGRLMEYKVLPMAISITLLFILGCVTIGFASTTHICYSRSQKFGNTVTNSRFMIDMDTDDSLVEDFFFRSSYKVVLWIAVILLVFTQMAETILSLYGLNRLCRSPKVGGEFDYIHKLRMSTSSSSDGNLMLMDQDDPSSTNVSRAYKSAQYQHEVVEEMWDKRCRFICKCAALSSCYLFGGRNLMDSSNEQQDFKDIATVLADYFENIGLIDVVSTDIMTGVIMIQKVQRQRVINARTTVLNEKEGLVSVSTAVTKQNMSDRLTNDSCDIAEYGSSSFTSDGEILSSSDYPHARDNTHLNNSALLMTTDRTAFMMWMKSNSQSSVQYETRQHKVLRSNVEFDRSIISEGARFSRYALAIYTWVLYFYMYPVSGPWRLFYRKLKALSCNKYGTSRSTDSRCQKILLGQRKDNDTVGDNFLCIHKDSLLAIAGISDTDFIYANFKNDCNEMPYCILVDHKWRSVVLSIRGTLSLEDLFVDGSLRTESLEELGYEFGFDGTGERCHAGILACTKLLYQDLLRHGILEQLLEGNHALYPKYTLRIVGHSVGAGIATILSLMLRQRYPNLRCLAFSPPGQFTWRLGNESKEFCYSFVLDSDFVPRLTILSMEHLRNEVLDMIGRLKVSKKDVMNSVVNNNFHCCRKQEVDELDVIEAEIDRMLYPKGQIPTDSAFFSQLLAFQEIVSERKELRGEFTKLDLYPPGRIIHLVKTGQRNGCSLKLAKCVSCGMSNAGSEYTPVWAENDDFNEVVVSQTMWTDHFPNRVCTELEKLASSFNIDTSMGPNFETSDNSVNNII